MIDGLLWKTIKSRPTWGNDGYLEWMVLQRHRIFGYYRTVHVHEDFLHRGEFAKRTKSKSGSETDK